MQDQRANGKAGKGSIIHRRTLARDSTTVQSMHDGDYIIAFDALYRAG